MNQIKSYKKYDPEVKLPYDKAVELGINTYWTGNPCSNGHLAHRYVCNRKCVDCELYSRRRQRSKALNDEALQVGINPDLRRKIEDIRLMKEYSIDL